MKGVAPSAMVNTYYCFCTDDDSYTGTMDVPRGVWEYSTNEFSNDFVVGIPEDPILDYIVKKLELQVEMIDISYWKLNPETKEDQIKYLGCILDEMQ